MKRRPLATLALGLALYTSLASVCCGFGVIAAPWFACELLGLLVSEGTGQPLVRNAAWLWAGLVQMIAVIVLTSVASLALMSLGSGAFVEGARASSVVLPAELWQGLLVAIVAGNLVLILTVYFQYAPTILIERGGGFTAALLESARLVALHGALRTWATSALAHGLPMLCAVLLVALLALRATLSSAIVYLLLLLPALVLSLVLGQGMIVASYLHLHAEVTDPRKVPPGGEPSKRGTAVWAVLLSVVALGPLLVSVSLLKPALPRQLSLARDALVVLTFSPSEGGRRERYVPGTAVRLSVTDRAVRVIGSDGGGAGSIPLPPAQVRSVRVAQAPPLLFDRRRAPRAESTFAIEIGLDDRTVLTTWIDEAGVRLDDTWERRLSVRLPPWAGLLHVGCFIWTALWIARAVPPQGRIRRKLSATHPLALGAPARELAEHEQRLRTALRARVIRAALWLLPPALGSLAIGLSALLR